jgi:hypothetical protein
MSLQLTVGNVHTHTLGLLYKPFKERHVQPKLITTLAVLSRKARNSRCVDEAGDGHQ